MPFNYQNTYNAALRKSSEKNYIGFERYGKQGIHSMFLMMLEENKKSNDKLKKLRNKQKEKKNKETH